jgi:hypothetical protein
MPASHPAMPFLIMLNAAAGRREAGDARASISPARREAGRGHHLGLAEIAQTVAAQAKPVGGAA